MTQQVQEEQQNDDEKMGYFTPGEITVAVRHPSGIEPDELLERLRHELREMLAEFWQQGGQERSLLLRKLQQSFGFDHGVYQTALRASSLLQDDDLELLQQAVVDLAQEDVVTFPAGEQRRSQLSQVFLRIEDEEANIYHYSEVLIFLAAELTLRQERVSGDRQGIRIQGISPGWRFGGAPGGNLISGGPGAKPVPPEGQVSAEDARIHLEIGGAGGNGQAPLSRLGRKLQKNGDCLEEVDVYVLDTAPPCEDLRTAYEQWGQNGQNAWIARLLEGLELPDDCSGDEIHGVRLHLYYREFDEKERELDIKDKKYKMSDHGFFIAGLIHALAPTVPIYLFKVLNNHGVGTSSSLAWGLCKALNMIQERGRPAVINCSLTLGVDFDGDGDDNSLESFIAATHRWLISPLNESFHELDNVALVVAAAGNDSKAGKQRELTRYPAAYKQVVGVGALKRDASPTEYTNVPDDPQWQGFIVFGGDLDPADDTTASTTDGILSVYSAPDYPNGAVNEGGWARWAGTSFATPLITGVLAQLLCTDMSRNDALRLLQDTVSEGADRPHRLPLRQGRPA